jgi:hypothetical protein
MTNDDGREPEGAAGAPPQSWRPAPHRALMGMAPSVFPFSARARRASRAIGSAPTAARIPRRVEVERPGVLIVYLLSGSFC